jgi:titin
MLKNITKQTIQWTIILVLLIGLGVQVKPVLANGAIIVNSALDADDADLSDYICATAAGECTLRAAIRTANSLYSMTGTTIAFSISPETPAAFGKVITINQPLPAITARTIIQGPNLGEMGQPGAGQAIILDGNGGSYSGLEVRASNCVIKNLTIRDFGRYGIEVNRDSSNNPVTGILITGNRIGNFDTIYNSGNDLGGIRLIDTASTVIGGDTEAERNVISGNGGYGIRIEGGGTNLVIGNYIGVGGTGISAKPNSVGIYIDDSDGNTIGGAIAGRRNIISGNTSDGIQIEGDNNYVFGNYIGTDISGTSAISNGNDGIRSGENAGSNGTNYIGGVNPGEGNLISGNGHAGIGLYLSQEISIRGNIIGLNTTQNAAIANNFGITVGNSLTTIIGGTTAGSGNVISGNTRQGIFAESTGSGNTLNTSIKGNWIGVNSAGTAFPNGMDGIVIKASSSNTIGGTTSGAGNIIANNGDNGIELQYAYDSKVEGNLVFNNTALGIDVKGVSGSGVTPNDTPDADNIQNFPELTRISFPSSGNVRIQGTVTTLASEQLDIYFYANDACDPSGFGEGQVYLGTYHTTANSSGLASFSILLPISRSYMYYTATAFGPSNGSSEFSACKASSVYLPMIYK